MASRKQKPKPKKARSKTLKKAPATTRSTGGAGFDFEDRAAAWLLLKMLRAEAIPGIEIAGRQLQMQTHALGWEIDDILVEGVTNSAEPAHLAISCKSNVQVTASGLPKDFVEAAWRQRRKTGPMDQERDCLALITRGRNIAFDAIWSDVKGWCADGIAVSALANISASRKHAKVFNSVKPPLADGTYNPADEDVVALVRHIEVIPLDFQLTPSHMEREAIAQCRDLLRSGTAQTAKDLWQKLIKLSTQARLRAGTIRLTDLWATLRPLFDLKDHPDFVASWRVLKAITEEYRSAVETSLPTGFHVTRAQDIDDIAQLLTENAISVVYGNSGSGKSALAKSILDERFPDWRQIWLGPEQLDAVLSHVKRAALSLSDSLEKILSSSLRPKNILVIDAAERLTAECITKAKHLIRNLVADHGTDGGWHVLIVGQTEAWANGQLSELAGGPPLPKNHGVQELSSAEVRDALRSAPALGWLVLHDEAVAALGNLRALGWVMKAESQFRSETAAELISLPAIADRVWRYWTNGQARLQTLLMRLADRDANFERSFELSRLQMDEAAAFDDRPQQCPLRLNERNRIEFEHDLATDWSRYQRLKEIAGEVNKWAALASNPLWHGALRMLGQSLLRAPAGAKTAWDAAFETIENSKEAPLAADILLDALCLDPFAETFLTERADMLFENHGARLRRLLNRFHHIATVSGIPRELLKADNPLNLYMEATYRTPILGRWLRVARFLAGQQQRLAELMSPVVSKICETWLTTTPKEAAPGVRVPFRKEFGEIALATARALQVAQGQHVMFIGDGERPVYSAAFAAASDLPDEVTQWALEMAQRRPPRADVLQKISDFHAKKAKEHKEKLRTDAEYRKQHERRRSAPTMIPSGRPLPAWPLGPEGRIENDFGHTCLHTQSLGHLMRARPLESAEILLATLIEDSPEESYSSSPRMDEELGLEFDHEGYPTAFWKSPFFQFLNIAPEVALETLLQLIGFCTERWTSEFQDPARIPRLLFDIDGREQSFMGNHRVFDWAQENSLHNGQLHSALAALERWLCHSIDEGKDVTPILKRLLTSQSAGILGVLVNIGKYRPSLFGDVLRPLLTNPVLYEWDDYRVDAVRHRFDACAWARAGETIFQIAKDWIFAPYRQRSLRAIAAELANTEPTMGEFLENAIQQWKAPSFSKEALERRILCAELDRRNYASIRDEKTKKEAHRFQYPEALAKDIATYQDSVAPKLQALSLPYHCEKILELPRLVTDEEAAKIAATLASISAEDDAETKNRARAAVASALAVKAPAWLLAHPEVLSEVDAIIDEGILAIGETAEALRKSAIGINTGELKFVARAVTSRWIGAPDSKAEMQILRLVTSRDAAALATTMQLAYAHRSMLGSRWRQLLYFGLLWSGLSCLAPGYDARPDAAQRWTRWLRWLRSRKLEEINCSDKDINPLSVAQRVSRIEDARSRKTGGGLRGQHSRGKRRHGGLDSHELEGVFSWLLRGRDATDFGEDLGFAARLWEFEVWRRYGDVDDEDRGHEPPSKLGYLLLENFAQLLLAAPAKKGTNIWRPILSLGPDAHYSIGHFISCWFIDLTHQTDTTRLSHHWRAMLEFALGAPNWANSRRWYHAESLLCQLLGFGADKQIAALPAFKAIVFAMRDLYERWARKHLGREEDNIAGFCGFLASDAGALIRLDGLIWVADAVTSPSTPAYWGRDRTGNAMVEMLDVIITQDAQALKARPPTLDALVRLAATLGARQVSAALALQERISRLA